MSDPCAQLRPALKAMLRADPGVLVAFGMSPVQVVDFAGPNLKVPYVIIGEAGATPELAECIDGAEADATLHVFSRTQPPAFTEAAAIAAAITAAVLSHPARPGRPRRRRRPAGERPLPDGRRHRHRPRGADLPVSTPKRSDRPSGRQPAPARGHPP